MRLFTTNLQKSSNRALFQITVTRQCSTGKDGKSFIELVKILRKETSAGVVDCRDALIAGGNDIQKAKDWLFDQAKITAAKKSGRKAQEGGVAVSISGATGAIVEINSETDFVGKEKTFVDSCDAICKAIQENYAAFSNKRNPDLKAVLELPLKYTISGFETAQVKDAFQQLTFLYKENIVLRRATLFPQEDFDPSLTHLYKYVHTCLSPTFGKIGCLVQLNTDKAIDEKQQKELAKLGNIIATQMVGGKPYSIAGTEKMETVDDSEICHEPDFVPAILNQNSVLESGTIQQIMETYSKKLGTTITLANFGRWERNSGQDKDEANLMDDVNSLLNESRK